MSKKRLMWRYDDEVAYAVCLDNCIGRCPVIYEVDPSDFYLRDLQAIFSSRKEAEEYIAERWGTYPVECEIL